MRHFKSRSPELELMDSDEIGFAEFENCLKDLEKVNLWTLAYRPTLKWISQFYNLSALSVWDVGSGGGDMVRRLWRRLTSNNVNPELTGIDLSPWSKPSAEMRTPDDMKINYVTADIFSLSSDQKVDVIISSLFTHHLTDAQAVAFIQWMERHIIKGWFINDLHRHFIAYYFIKYAIRLLSRNRLIVSDAPISVARAFTKKDWRQILVKAGLAEKDVTIKWYFPFRYCIGRVKS